jgi:hypothetical protein
MSVSNTTDLHKTARSFTAKNVRGRAFGDPSPALPAIDDLQTEEYDARLAFVMSVISTWAYADERALAAKLLHYGIEGVGPYDIDDHMPANYLDVSRFSAMSSREPRP